MYVFIDLDMPGWVGNYLILVEITVFSVSKTFIWFVVLLQLSVFVCSSKVGAYGFANFTDETETIVCVCVCESV